jgi:hypothetical protein
MDTKTSQITSWDAILSPPWAYYKRWIPMGFNGWPQNEIDLVELTTKYN